VSTIAAAPRPRTRSSASNLASSIPGATARATRSVSPTGAKTTAPLSHATCSRGAISKACKPIALATRLAMAGANSSPGGAAWTVAVATARDSPFTTAAYSVT
jgi:hypothetical protein